ncbi:MAG: hypothetical protein KAR83_08125 [Thermodesulfovibrionales bacterium]|nr:hypothetical protein [Thermodesulfovibrionales bacterium]
MINIVRGKSYVDALRAYKIILDGNVIGEIKNGQEIEFDLPPGKHEISLKIDWCGSNCIEFECDVDTVEFECGSNLQGWRMLLVFIYIIFHRNKYIWLRMNRNVEK